MPAFVKSIVLLTSCSSNYSCQTVLAEASSPTKLPTPTKDQDLSSQRESPSTTSSRSEYSARSCTNAASSHHSRHPNLRRRAPLQDSFPAAQIPGCNIAQTLVTDQYLEAVLQYKWQTERVGNNEAENYPNVQVRLRHEQTKAAERILQDLSQALRGIYCLAAIFWKGVAVCSTALGSGIVGARTLRNRRVNRKAGGLWL